MIETYTFTHKGGLEEYDDEVFVGFGSFTVAVVVNGNHWRSTGYLRTTLRICHLMILLI